MDYLQYAFICLENMKMEAFCFVKQALMTTMVIKRGFQGCCALALAHLQRSTFYDAILPGIWDTISN